ncbi:hypothetical protein C5167_030739 [Papaver somniferum]|nr:hypothetical protein C5167_030739 [Papaver somniferum]
MSSGNSNTRFVSRISSGRKSQYGTQDNRFCNTVRHCSICNDGFREELKLHGCHTFTKMSRGVKDKSFCNVQGTPTLFRYFLGLIQKNDAPYLKSPKSSQEGRKQ